MNYAVIDLGSNTIRLSIYSYANGMFKRLISQKEVVGLAGYVKKNHLELEGINNACDILNGFREIAIRFVKKKDIHLFATASLRGIDNQQQACEIIERSCGLRPEVLSGEEEARLDFLGASHCVTCTDGILIDIGGASTEFVWFQNAQPVELVSIPIGCLSLYAKSVNSIIPTKNERKKIKRQIRENFNEYLDWDIQEKLPLMIGVGGTVRAALKLSCELFSLPKDNRELYAKHVVTVLRKLTRSDDKIFHTLYKRVPERVLTIFTGMMILNEAIKRFPCENLVVSTYGVREGYLIDRVL